MFKVMVTPLSRPFSLFPVIEQTLHLRLQVRSVRRPVPQIFRRKYPLTPMMIPWLLLWRWPSSRTLLPPSRYPESCKPRRFLVGLEYCSGPCPLQSPCFPDYTISRFLDNFGRNPDL